jgi:PAS domain S-box-containing protein
MLKQIQQNYTQRLTLGTLGRTLGRQSAYLGRLFRDEVGITVHEYVTRARMINGAVQVRSGVKIEAVALELGYRSKKNFYLQFKRRFGMTPEAYRLEHHEAAVGDSAAFEPSRDVQNSRVGTPDSSTFVRCTARLEMVTDRTTDRRSSGLRLLSRRMMMPTLMGSSIAMLVTDDTGCYVGANKTAVSMTGYSVDELRGMPVEVLFSNDSQSDTRCRLQILLPASSSLPTNAVLRPKSADPVYVHLTSAENLLRIVNR